MAVKGRGPFSNLPPPAETTPADYCQYNLECVPADNTVQLREKSGDKLCEQESSGDAPRGTSVVEVRPSKGCLHHVVKGAQHYSWPPSKQTCTSLLNWLRLSKC